MPSHPQGLAYSKLRNWLKKYQRRSREGETLGGWDKRGQEWISNDARDF